MTCHRRGISISNGGTTDQNNAPFAATMKHHDTYSVRLIMIWILTSTSSTGKVKEDAVDRCLVKLTHTRPVVINLSQKCHHDEVPRIAKPQCMRLLYLRLVRIVTLFACFALRTSLAHKKGYLEESGKITDAFRVVAWRNSGCLSEIFVRCEKKH